MASLLGKLTQLARSPQGQRLIADATRRAQAAAKDPANRDKLERIARELGKRTRRSPR